MTIKTGVDIIEVDRVQEAIESQGERFLRKVYTKNEIEYCSNTGKMTYQHYAVRFAAKEAVYKAISEIIPLDEDDILGKIEIINTKTGKPIVNLDALDIKNIESMDLSLSHIKNYAIASFTIIFKQ